MVMRRREKRSSDAETRRQGGSEMRSEVARTRKARRRGGKEARRREVDK